MFAQRSFGTRVEGEQGFAFGEGGGGGVGSARSVGRSEGDAGGLEMRVRGPLVGSGEVSGGSVEEAGDGDEVDTFGWMVSSSVPLLRELR